MKNQSIAWAGLVSLTALLASHSPLQAKDPITVVGALNNLAGTDWEVRVMKGPSESKGVIDISENGQVNYKYLALAATPSASIDKETVRDPANLFRPLKAGQRYSIRYQSDQDGKMLQYLKIRPADGAGGEWTTLKVQMLTTADGKAKVAILRVAYSNPEFRKINKPVTVKSDYDNVVQLSSNETGSISILKDSYAKALAAQ